MPGPCVAAVIGGFKMVAAADTGLLELWGSAAAIVCAAGGSCGCGDSARTRSGESPASAAADITAIINEARNIDSVAVGFIALTSTCSRESFFRVAILASKRSFEATY
jgi:hypothetical protein